MNDSVFDNLPFNTDKYYVAAKTKSGCEVYIPVKYSDSASDKKAQLVKELAKIDDVK